MAAVCELCFRHCSLSEGQTGFCRARGNRGGKVVPLSYGKVVSLALDPIEKKPLKRFCSGGNILSIGTFGCNMACPFCQNYELSQAGEGELPHREISPEELADLAEALKDRGNVGIAYTYNEPLTNYEFVRDCAAVVHDRGMVNVLVSNGLIEEGPWRELLPLIDAANIDLKGFTDGWYRRLGGDLGAVMRNIEIAAKNCHVEVTTLIVPGENDNEDEIRSMARWLSEISPDIVLHLSRFFPRWKMDDRSPTPVEIVYRLTEVAGEYLEWVYTGNC